MAVGGDVVEITYNHPTLGSGVLYPKSAEDSNIDLGGLRSADEANGIAGNGEAIHQMNRVRWSFEVPAMWDQLTKEELQKMVALAGDPEEADWTFSMINGVVYAGKGKPVGDLIGNGNTSQVPMKFSGGGILSKL